MKNTVKKLAVLLATSLFITMFTACGLKKADVIGVWEDTYEYNGNTYIVMLALGEDGNYVKTSFKNGSLNDTWKGDYEIKGKKVNVYNGDSSVYHGESMTYKYKGGKLINGSAELTKVK